MSPGADRATSSQGPAGSLGPIGKTTTTDRARQAYFPAQLIRITRMIGEPVIPVFIDFRGGRRRLDKGCIGHPIAAGVLEPPVDNAEGFVDQVRLRLRRLQPSD